MGIYNVTIGVEPLLNDDAPQTLINKTPNLIIQERFSLIQGRIKVTDCKSCFAPDSYINLKGDQVDGLHISDNQPIYYYSYNGQKIPLYKFRRMSAIPSNIYKLLTFVVNPSLAKNIYNQFISILVLIFLFLGVRKKIDTFTAFSTVFLCSISPIFISSYTSYFSEQLFALLFWMIFYLIQSEKKVLRATVCGLFVFGLMVKLNFLVVSIPLFMIFKKDFYKNKGIVVATAILSLIYIGLLLQTNGASSEIIERTGEGYGKPFSHWVLLLQELIAMVGSPIVFLNDQLNLFDLTGSYYNKLNFSTLKRVGSIAIFPLAFLLINLKEKKGRVFIGAFFIWAVLAFLASHNDLTYTTRISEIYSILCLLFSMALILFLKNKTKLSYVVIAAFIVFQFYNLNHWMNIYRTVGPESSQKMSLYEDIAKYLVDNKIERPILMHDEREWGYLEFLSKEKILPIYTYNLDTRIPLEDIFSIDNEGYLLLYYPKKEIFYRRYGTSIISKETNESVLKAAQKSHSKVSFIKTFKSSDEVIYKLIYFKNALEFEELSAEENTKLLEIPHPSFYR